MVSWKRIVTEIFTLPGLPRRFPGLIDWSSVCMRQEREEYTVKLSTCLQRVDWWKGDLVNEMNQVPGVRDQVCGCRKEAANTQGETCHVQSREENCVTARREGLREKRKEHLWEYEIMVSIADGWHQNHSYFWAHEFHIILQLRKTKNRETFVNFQSRSVYNIIILS